MLNNICQHVQNKIHASANPSLNFRLTETKVKQIYEKTMLVSASLLWQNTTFLAKLEIRWKKRYEPHAIEQHWYSSWEDKGFFRAPRSKRKLLHHDPSAKCDRYFAYGSWFSK